MRYVMGSALAAGLWLVAGSASWGQDTVRLGGPSAQASIAGGTDTELVFHRWRYYGGFGHRHYGYGARYYGGYSSPYYGGYYSTPYYGNYYSQPYYGGYASAYYGGYSSPYYGGYYSSGYYGGGYASPYYYNNGYYSSPYYGSYYYYPCAGDTMTAPVQTAQFQVPAQQPNYQVPVQPNYQTPQPNLQVPVPQPQPQQNVRPMPPASQENGYQYDGGPRYQVPMPNANPTPNNVPSGIVPIDGRLVSMPTGTTGGISPVGTLSQRRPATTTPARIAYPAYGDTPLPATPRQR